MSMYNNLDQAPQEIQDCLSEYVEKIVSETFDTEEEVISKMNDNQYGLSSGVYTSNLSRGMRVSKAIRAGITFVNTYRLISPSAPFGGIKDSGLGYKEGVIEAMKSFTNVKTFSLPW